LRRPTTSTRPHGHDARATGSRFTWVLIAACFALITATVSAAEVKFTSADALAKNFDVKAKPDSLKVERGDAADADGAAAAASLVFTAPKNLTIVALYTPGGRATKSPADQVESTFRLQPGTSFGVIVRGSADNTDGYLVLVNAFPKNGAMLRVFRSTVWPQKQLAEPIGQKNFQLDPEQWQTLTVSCRNGGDGAVTIDAQVKAADGSAGKTTKLSADDKNNPLTNPGRLGLRFFGNEDGSIVRVRSLSVEEK
jgi:hypothetical protein